MGAVHKYPGLTYLPGDRQRMHQLLRHRNLVLWLWRPNIWSPQYAMLTILVQKTRHNNPLHLERCPPGKLYVLCILARLAYVEALHVPRDTVLELCQNVLSCLLCDKVFLYHGVRRLRFCPSKQHAICPILSTRLDVLEGYE